MKNTRSRAEARLARLLATTPPPPPATTSGTPRIDFVYPSEDDQRRLDASTPRRLDASIRT